MSEQPRPTPRTDRAVQFAKQSIGNAPKVSAEFARLLERESDARAERIAELESFRESDRIQINDLCAQLEEAGRAGMSLAHENAKLREASRFAPDLLKFLDSGEYDCGPEETKDFSFRANEDWFFHLKNKLESFVALLAGKEDE